MLRRIALKYEYTITYRKSYVGLITNRLECFETWIQANNSVIEATTFHLCVGVAMGVTGPTIHSHLSREGGLIGRVSEWGERV